MRHAYLFLGLLALTWQCAAQPVPPAGEQWSRVRGEAAQLAVGADGAVFALDRSGRPWRRAPGPASIWSPLPGRFVRIDAGPPGIVWALDQDGRVFRLSATSWLEVAGAAADIGVGPEGSIYVLASDGTVARFDAARGAFVRLAETPPAARAIDVDEAGLPWVVLEHGSLMRHDGTAWRAVPSAIAIRSFAIGAEGTVLAIAADLQLYRLDAERRSWMPVATPAPPLAAGIGPGGKPWIATAGGEILAAEVYTPTAPGRANAAPVFTRELPWTRVRGTGREIAIGPNGEAYCIGDDGRVWQWKGRETWSSLPGRFERIAVAPAGLPWGIDERGRILQFRGGSWLELPGEARDIAIGASGTAWVVLPDGTPARWEPGTRTWEALRGIAASRIAVEPDGRPWVVTADGSVLRHDGKEWRPEPGVQARDLDIGPDGTVFAAGMNNRPYRFDPTQREWIVVNGEATRIAVGPAGVPWAITPRAEIYAASRFEEELDRKAVTAFGLPAPDLASQIPLFSAVKPTQRGAFFFQKVPGVARDIAIGNDGSVFAIGFGGNLMRWNNGRNLFLPFPGAGQRLAVQRDGNPWVVTAAGEVFRYDGRNWRIVRNIRALDIAIGGAAENRDDVFITDAEQGVHRYDAAADRFDRVFSASGGAAPAGLQVAVDGRGRPWTITRDNQVFRCDADPCTFVWQGAREISIGPDNSVFAVDMDRHLRRFDAKTGRFERLDPTVSGLDAVAVGPRGVPWIVKTRAEVFVEARAEVFAAGFFERDESRDIDIAQTTVLAATTTPATPVFTFSVSMRFDAVAVAQPVFNIAISPKGLIVAIEPGGNVYVFDERTQRFDRNDSLRPPAPFFRLAVEADGTLWGVDNANRLLRREGTRYVSYPGLTSATPFPSAIGISVGGEGSVMATSPDNNLFRFNPKSRRFEPTTFQFAGFDNQVSVDAKGRPWIIDAFNDIYEFNGVGFVLRPGKTQDVWAGVTGSVFVCDTANRLKRWNPAAAAFEIILNVQCTNVAVNVDGRPWIVTPTGQVLRAR